MMILTENGFIYKAVPNMVPKKDAKGNLINHLDGFRSDGIPLMKVIMFSSERDNQALKCLIETGHIIVSKSLQG